MTGDTVYAPYALRAWRQEQGLAYVRAAPRNAALGRGLGRRRDVAALHADLAEADWQ